MSSVDFVYSAWLTGSWVGVLVFSLTDSQESEKGSAGTLVTGPATVYAATREVMKAS